MRTAILLHGNLRTFLMPMRGTGRRLCDEFMQNVVCPNGADVFAYTDTSNFFLDGVQYYPLDRKIEVLNNDGFRLHDKIAFISSEEARKLIADQINSALGGTLKNLVIEDPYDASKDPKFGMLNDADVKGSSPALLIHQWRKLKLAYGLMEHHEAELAMRYDLIVKWRFDLNVAGRLDITGRDYSKTDVYVAGINDPIIYDWHSFGTRPHMEIVTNLYDKLGFMLPNRTWMTECRRCAKRVCFGPRMDSCPRCGTTTEFSNCEITLAPEHHLFKLFGMHGTRINNSGYPGCPYHYKETSSNNRSMPEIIKGLGLSDVTVITHTAGKEIGTQKFD